MVIRVYDTQMMCINRCRSTRYDHLCPEEWFLTCISRWKYAGHCDTSLDSHMTDIWVVT